jgi:hypothetical protein
LETLTQTFFKETNGRWTQCKGKANH